jgi:hypothetical protein
MRWRGRFLERGLTNQKNKVFKNKSRSLWAQFTRLDHIERGVKRQTLFRGCPINILFLILQALYQKDKDIGTLILKKINPSLRKGNGLGGVKVKINEKTSKGRTPKHHDCQIISIYSRVVLAECYNRLQFRLTQEHDPRQKRAIQKKMDLFAKRLAEVEAILGKSRRNI